MAAVAESGVQSRQVRSSISSNGNRLRTRPTTTKPPISIKPQNHRAPEVVPRPIVASNMKSAPVAPPLPPPLPANAPGVCGEQWSSPEELLSVSSGRFRFVLFVCSSRSLGRRILVRAGEFHCCCRDVCACALIARD